MKLALFEIRPDGGLGRAAAGQLAGLGNAPHFQVRAPDGRVLAEQRWAQGKGLTDEDFLVGILGFAEHALGHDTLAVVGHRVAHGGAALARPEAVTPALLEALEALVPLAPLHQPHSLAPMRALAKLRPALPQFACFDTAFHHTMPAVATRFAIPRALHDAGVRRYGFHGLSYEYIAETLKEQVPALAAGRVVVAHLGDGASLCALRGGKSFDITTGFSALDGLMAGTIDPGVLLYLQRHRGMTAHEVEDLLCHKSGLLGVSGLSGDLRVLEASTDPRAVEALALFTLRIVREIGGLSAVLGGIDGLVFTGGIGEHSAQLRKDVCGRLGIPLDVAKNEVGLGKISSRETRLEVWVIPTDEEAMIARHASMRWARMLPAEKSKLFFSEEKKQKTLNSGAHG